MSRGFVIEDDSIYRDEDSEDSRVALKARMKQELIEKIATEWSEVHDRIEQKSFRSREERDEEADCLAEQCSEEINDKICDLIARGKTSFSEDEYDSYRNNPWRRRAGKEIEEISEEATLAIQELEQKFEEEFYKEIREKENEDRVRLEVIEELLAENGARMMRPYEHWNEEERYMEYMENRYDYGDDY